MANIKYRLAEPQDRDDLFAWRNEPHVRNMSLNQEVLRKEEHDQWFESSLCDPGRKLFIIEYESKKIGVVRIDRLNEHAGEISINLAPNARGKGFGSEILRYISDNILSSFEYLILIARIKANNISSIKAFKNAGFIGLLNCVTNTPGEVITIMSKVKKG